MVEILNKESEQTHLGESWEVSDVEGSVSVVSNGAYKGKTIKEILIEFKRDFVGKKVYSQFGNEFPLLLKFIDAKEDLSIQLHPNDSVAKELHNSFGKTEMWYVVDADDDSKLTLGFKKPVDLLEFKGKVESNQIESILHTESVNKGDCYYIEGGLIHSIGKGCLIAEIQQTSDITYRIYDWNRTDDNGKTRKLHLEKAYKAINFDINTQSKRTYNLDKKNKKLLVESQFFSTNILKFEKDSIYTFNNTDSFKVWMCVEGCMDIEHKNYKLTLTKGETVVFPSDFGDIKVSSTFVKVLEVYI